MVVAKPPDPGRDGRARRFFELTRPGLVALQRAGEVQARMWAGLRLKRAGRATS
jgi:hypothetical protein